MVFQKGQFSKYCEPRFAASPWTELSPEWLALDRELASTHVARTVATAVCWLNLEPLFFSFRAGGSDAVSPALMLRVVLVEMMQGRHHPSQWYRDMAENAALKWVALGIRPSRSTWYSFRDRVEPFLEGWFQQVLEMAVEQDITPAKRASLDGSFVAANASRHHMLNETVLTKHQAALEDTCKQDRQGQVPAKVPSWMAKKPSTRLQQIESYKRARKRLEELQAINLNQNPARRRPEEKMVVSATDVEAAIGRDKEKIFRPLYNVQVMQDLDSQLILNYDVFPQNSDGGTLRPMLQRQHDLFGISLSLILCDSHYVTGNNLALCSDQKITLCGPWQANDYSSTKKAKKKPGESEIPKEQFIWLPDDQQYECPEGYRLSWIGKESRKQADGEVNVVHRFRCSPRDCQACPRQTSCTTNPARGRAVRRSEHEEVIELHRNYMETPEAKATYRLRKQTIELQYANMKENRDLRRFSGRGLRRARTEIGLLSLAHNLVVVDRYLHTRRGVGQTSEEWLAQAS